MPKISIIVLSLVEEAEKYSNTQLEAEITANINITKIPWGKHLIRVLVIGAS